MKKTQREEKIELKPIKKPRVEAPVINEKKPKKDED
jgi:hypothetical protein